MAAVAVDVGYLAASYAVPETNLHSLLSEPTLELVQSLLAQIQEKARDYDDLKSERLRAELQLEDAVRNADTRASTLKSTTDKALKDAEELRQKLAREETARQQIETQLQTLQTTATGSTSQVQTLESRIKTLEAQNRDTVSLHEAKSAAYDRLAEELSAQHQKFVALRKQVGDMEEKNQSLETAATSVKFRETNFQQEIELLRKNNDWFETELKTRAADNTKFRKEKNAQIAEITRANADASQTIDSLRSRETSQTKRIEELEQRIEQSLLQIQHLQEEATTTQESFRAELQNSKRLAELHQESANTVRKRLEEVQEQLTITGDQAAEELGRLQAELETEGTKAAEYEGRVGELETLLENQETQLSELRSSAHIPGTPRRAINGSFDTPGRAGSPMVNSPGGSRLKGSVSMTQLYTENTKLKADVRALQDRDDKRTATMNEMLEELESRQPEIEELRQENERLTSETGEISSLLEEAIQEKNTARRETRKAQGDYQGVLRQRELDRQLIRDATFQSKLLLYQQKHQEEGMESLSQEEQQFLQETAQNEIPERLLDEEDTATSRLLSKHLVLFKNVSQLVEKNQELLRMIREVAEQYEGSEAQAKAAEHQKDREELLHVRDTLAQYEDEIRSLKLQSQSFKKERDMYRRIITNRGQGSTGADAVSLFDQSMGDRATATPPTGSHDASVDQAAHSRQAEAIKDLQARLDAVNAEIGTDRATFKKQIDDLAKENRQLQSDNVRLNTKQEMAQQRFDLQQHKIDSLESAKGELNKQNNRLHDDVAKADLKRQQDSENLIEVRSQIDSLERENTNLKASQSLWKTIEARLTEDRNNLADDKARLNKIITDMQTVRNEHDLAEAQNRRNLQSRADALDAELQNAKRKLEEEIEEHKRDSLRYEWEQSEKQKRVDDLLKAANEVRQELASVKTARDHLQMRVTELQTELRNVERSHVAHAQQAPQINGSAEQDEDGLSREDQLSQQLADLQRQFERAQEDLASANSQIETYKRISQEAEEALQDSIDAQEQLKSEYEEKDAIVTEQKQRVEEISSELATTNTELSNLRGTQEQETLQLTQQKATLDAEIAHLQDELNDYRGEVENKSQDVTAQAEIANKAQQDYENEFRKHGETMNNLRTLREERDKLRDEVMQYKSDAETARASLASSEEQWSSDRERYIRELAKAQSQQNELTDSNKTLYGQFDVLNAQIASLKKERVSVAASQGDAGSFESSQGGLQALNKMLRDEKDILQVQINGKELELQRSRQELAHRQEQLDRANEKLVAEQSLAQSRHSGANFQALQDSIEQLNLHRESNTTLRNENRRIDAELEEKKKAIEVLQNEVQPLRNRVMDLEGELEISNGHLKALEEDRDRWQKRHQDVLQRYDRIDPQELEDLKKQIEDLKTERDEASQQVGAIDERIQAARDEEKAALETLQSQWNVRREKIVDQAKERARKDNNEKTQLKEELGQVKGQLSDVQSELESTRRARDEANAKAEANANADVNMDEEGQVNEDGSDNMAEEKAALETRLAAAEAREIEQSNTAAYLGTQLEDLQEQKRNLETQIGELQTRIDELNNNLLSAQSQKTQANARADELQTRISANETTVTARDPTEPAPPSEDDGKLKEQFANLQKEVERVKEELAASQKEVEDLRTRADMSASIGENVAEDNAKPVAEQVAEQVSAEQTALQEREANLAEAEAKLRQLEADVKEQEARLEEDANARAKDKLEKMKNRANKMVKDGKEENARELEKLQKELEQFRNMQQEGTASVKTEVPGPEATEREIQDWISNNPVALAIIKRTVNKRVQTALAEQQKVTPGDAVEAPPVVNGDQEQAIAQKVEEATANIKAEHEIQLAQAVENARVTTKNQEDKRHAVKLSMAQNQRNKSQAQFAVVEKAAKETPETSVKEVYEEALKAKPPPPQPANTSANVPAVTQPTPQAVQAISSQPPATALVQIGQQQPASQSTAGLPQANGARNNNFGQPSFGQQPNPFAQAHGVGQQGFPTQMGAGFGFGGVPQPGFANAQTQQPQFNASQGRPNSPFNQQHPQHFQQGRGRGGGDVGTGPAALRNIMGGQPGQSGIPRGGGSGIPLPGGRGRGAQQQQAQQGQGPNTNAPGAGASQIGRGGGRGGGGRGRGGPAGGPASGQAGVPAGGQQPGSPMNPGASTFQPGVGRGQKRGPEDEGSQRGGKRARGGRGGAGGGAGAAGTGEE